MAKYLAALPFALVAFGCSDIAGEMEDESYTRKSLSSNQELRDYPCSSKNDGEQVILTNSDRVSFMYECTDGAWIGVEEGDVVKPGKSSDSKKSDKSSSSTKTSSSSSKSESSSSEAKSSSSAAAPDSLRSSSSRKTSTGTMSSSSSAAAPDSLRSSSSRKTSTGTMSSSAAQTSDLGTCATITGATEVDKGSPVQFKFTANPNRSQELAQMMLSGELSFAWDYGAAGTGESSNSAKSGVVTYSTSGPAGASVTVTVGAEEETIPCDLNVNGAPITCQCSSETPAVDFTSTPDVTWTATCTTDEAAGEISYEWDGVAGEATYTKTFTEAHEGYVPTLKVANQDNTKSTVPCTKVKVTEGPEYVFKIEGNRFPSSSDRLEVKSGACMSIRGNWSDEIFCPTVRVLCNMNAGSEPVSFTMTYGSEIYEETSSSYGGIWNSGLEIGTLSVGEVEFDGICVEFTGAETVECSLQ